MRLSICLTVVLGSLILAPGASAHGHRHCHTRECNVRVLSKHCDNGHTRMCVEWIIARHKIRGWGAGWMRRIPSCESGYSAYSHNPEGASGLYQFLPSTWASTPYRSRWIFSARWQAAAAAYMLRVGRAPGEWQCK